MMKTTGVATILMFIGLVALGIGKPPFKKGLSWAAWLDSWFFSF